MINTLQQPASLPFLISKNDRKLLVFCAFLLILLLGSSSQHDRRAFQRAFTGSKFFSEGVVRPVQNEDLLHEVHDVEPKKVVGARHAYAFRDEALFCDRTHYRTDVCVATARDVRVLNGRSSHGGSYQVLVSAEQGQEKMERVKPYTRKWETSVMESIDEVTVIKKVLINGSSDGTHISSPRMSSGQQKKKATIAPSDQSAKLHGIILLPRQSVKLQQHKQNPSSSKKPKRQPATDHNGTTNQELQRLHRERRSVARGLHDQMGVQKEKVPAATRAVLQLAVEPGKYGAFPECEVRHGVPAILFSTGGYTGNVYHDFNDGLIPLFITAQQYARGQVVLIVLEYHNWWMSKYAEVVAQISNYTVIDLAHDKHVHCFPEVTVGLRIHGELVIDADTPDQATIEGFQSMLRAAFAGPETEEADVSASDARRPRLVLLSRRSPRALLNEQEVIAMAHEIGFSVQVLAPTPMTRMADIYRMVSTCDVMLGVHGAAMTHLLFMRPGSTVIQVVPLGTDWAAATYYGEPAQRLGLKYVEYKVRGSESSLWSKYAPDDPVLVNPESINKKGWWETKRIYLEAQDVTVSLTRMRLTLLSAYAHATLTLSSTKTSLRR